MKRTQIIIVTVVASLLLSITSLSATSYDNIITPKFLQETFTFKNGESMKYDECSKRSYPTCTYVWGKPSSETRKATEKKYGLKPDGKNLMVIYAKARSQKDFKRVLSIYKDAVEVKGLGVTAVWSAQRQQLSMITKESLVIHVNVDGVRSKEPLVKAMTTAKHILKKL